MATHSSVLAWRIPWTEVPGGRESDTTKVSTWIPTRLHTLHAPAVSQRLNRKPIDLTVKRSRARTLSSAMDFCPPGWPALPAGQVTMCVDPGAIGGAFLCPEQLETPCILSLSIPPIFLSLLSAPDTVAFQHFGHGPEEEKLSPCDPRAHTDITDRTTS